MSYYYIILNIIIFFVYFFISCRFAKKLNLIDYPSDNKTHLKATPAVGGLIFYLFYITIYFQILLNLKVDIFYHNLTIFSFLIFLIGYFDDVKDHSPYLKSSLFIIIILIFLYFNEEILLKTIDISFINATYELNTFFQYFFTVLCFWLLMNSFNLADGFNGISISYALIIFISLILIFNLSNVENFIVLNFILFLSFSLILNLKNYFFLGNNGSYLISFFMSVLLIKFYNQNLSTMKFEADRIFLMLMIPGIDMLRLFVFRIMNKINPFQRDQHHLHHYLKRKISEQRVFIVYTLIICIPIILDNLIKDVTILLIISQILFYFLIINKLKN
ncbi:hypothetical protein OA178_00345 [Candidatus Pelagibacter sp.]|nr:hypothetical protein [Candidatus Pelagibacter sp.]